VEAHYIGCGAASRSSLGFSSQESSIAERRDRLASPTRQRSPPSPLRGCAT
jgi:hypothetical protein